MMNRVQGISSGARFRTKLPAMLQQPFFVAVHCGAGFHSPKLEKQYLKGDLVVIHRFPHTGALLPCLGKALQLLNHRSIEDCDEGSSNTQHGQGSQQPTAAIHNLNAVKADHLQQWSKHAMKQPLYSRKAKMPRKP